MPTQPLPLVSIFSPSSNARPEDAETTHAALIKIGYLRDVPVSQQAFPTSDTFRAIERFQEHHGLVADSKLQPYGPTASLIGSHLLSLSPGMKSANPCSSRRCHIDPRIKDRPTLPLPDFPLPSIEQDAADELCEHLYWNIDVPTCRAIGRVRGKAAAARCLASANRRYALCKAGHDLEALPPLDVWNN